MDLAADTPVFSSSGQLLGPAYEVVLGLLNAKMKELFESTFRDVDRDADPEFFAELTGLVVGAGETRSPLFVEAEAGLSEIARLEVGGRAHIEVRRIELTHARFGDVGFATGEGRIGDRDALLVITEHEGDRKLTVRVRPEDRRAES